MNKLSLKIMQDPLLSSFDIIISKLDNINDDNVFASIKEEVRNISNGTIMIEAISEYKVLNDYIALLNKIKNKENNTNDIILLKKITKDFKRYLNEIILDDELNELFLWYIWLNINELLTQNIHIDIRELFYPIPEFENVQFKKNDSEKTITLLNTLKSMLINKINEWESSIETGKTRTILTELHGLFNELYNYNYSRIFKAYWLSLKGRIKIALLDPNLELDNKMDLMSILEPVKNEISNFIVKGKIRKIENLHNVIISLLDHYDSVDFEKDNELSEIYKIFNLKYYKKITDLSKDKNFIIKYNKLIDNSQQINQLFKELINCWNSISTTSSIYSDDICPILEKILNNKNIFPVEDANVNKFLTIIEKLNNKYKDEDKIIIKKELLTFFANFVLLFEKYLNCSYLLIDNWQEDFKEEYEIMIKVINDEYLQNKITNKVHEIDKIKHKKETFKTVFKELADKLEQIRKKIDFYHNKKDDFYEELNFDYEFIENNQNLESMFIMINNDRLYKFFNEYFDIFKYIADKGTMSEELYTKSLSYLGVLSVYFSIINENEIFANEILETEYNKYFENKTTNDDVIIDYEVVENAKKELDAENKLLDAKEQNQHLVIQDYKKENPIIEDNNLIENIENNDNDNDNIEEQQDDVLLKSNTIQQTINNELDEIFTIETHDKNNKEIPTINDDINASIEDNTYFNSGTKELKVSTIEEYVSTKEKVDNEDDNVNDVFMDNSEHYNEENNENKQSDNIEEGEKNMNESNIIRINDNIVQELLDVFIEEARDAIIPELENNLELVQTSDDDIKEYISVIKRNYHTLKGSSAQVGLKELSVIYKSLEERFSDLLIVPDLVWSDDLTDIVEKSINFTNIIFEEIEMDNEFELNSEEIYEALDKEQKYREMIAESEFIEENKDEQNTQEYESINNKNEIKTDVSSMSNIINNITSDYNDENELDNLLEDIQNEYKILSQDLIITDSFVENIRKISFELDDIDYINYYNTLINKLENLINKQTSEKNISNVFEIKPVILNTLYSLINNEELPKLGDYNYELIQSIDESDANKINELYDKVINSNNNINDEFNLETNDNNSIFEYTQDINHSDESSKIVLDKSQEEFNNNILKMEQSLESMIEEMRTFNKYFANIQRLLNTNERE